MTDIPKSSPSAPVQRTLNNRDINNLIHTRQYALAEKIILKVIEVYPENTWALTALGIIYRSTDRWVAAELCYKKALEVEPENPEVCSNYGNLLIDMDRMEEAVYYTQRAVEMQPDSLLFRKNYAVALRESRIFEEALVQYKWCHERQPDDANLQYDVAFVQFFLRQLDEAWDNAESRLSTNRISLPDTKGIPVWEGQSLRKKRILVLAEQGFGDTILMTRFLPKLKEMGAHVIFSCKLPLHPLFKHLPVELIGLNIGGVDSYDYYITMMSLPRFLGRDWLAWPKLAPMAIPEPAVAKFAFLAGQAKKKLKIGIVWSGSVTFAKNSKRAVELERFLKLAAAHPNVQFYSFQKGPREEDLKKFGQGSLIPLGHMFNDFSETAAAIKQMDCIIMTDSSVCHLAGTINVPVIDLLQILPYWLYFPEQSKTPLYPSMRFIWQKKAGDWDSVFGEVDKIVGVLASERQKKYMNAAAILKVIDSILP